MGPNPLEALFNPTSIAVFGASQSGTSVGYKVFANLLAGQFKGSIIPVNPKHKSVAGHSCFPSITKVKEDIDLAVIATPARTIPGILKQCGEAGVRNAIVLSAGFGEVGDAGKALEKDLIETARKHGIRFLGPNSIGLVRPWIGMNATFLKSSTPTGRLALVSQSGALCSAISDWAEPHHLGFSAVVSLGNSVNVDFGDTLQFLATDKETDAILLYIEGVRDARSFISALRNAARLKPVIVLKSGRHSQSSKAAHTHTGALIGSDSVFDAALERTGAVRAQTFGQLFAAAEILAPNRRSKGHRLGIVTNGGGAGVLAADRAGDLGVDIAMPDEKTVKALDKVLSPHWSKSNPVDILGDAKPEAYAKALKACIEDKNFDGVLVMLTPQAMTDATEAAKAIVETATKETRKPVLACWMGETSVREGRNLLSASGIPDFTTPERAVEAFSYLAQHNRNRRLALEVPGPLSNRAPHDLEGARMIIASALADGRDMLSDIESKAVLRAFHIPTNMTLEADSADKALIVGETLGFPLAVKINSPQITHKSDVGGVRINIANAVELKVAYREIIEDARAARPDATILGVTVEQMADVDDARELVIGASRDPVFGPTILFGAGGTMVEILRDSSVSLPPLNAVLASRQIDRTRVSKLLGAFRDRKPVDRDAVIDVLLRVSDMVCELPEIMELDINPLLAGPAGALAVDARVLIKRPPAGAGSYDHMAITPYPRHLVKHDHLADGTPLTIRPIRPEDAESEQNFVRKLSPEAKNMRFMGTLTQLTPTMLAQFTQIDYDREMALVAITGEGDNGVQQGVARYSLNSDNTSCEFAIVVSDKLQGQGIGTALMKALIEAARAHDLTEIEGTVLARNKPMLELMADLGFSIETQSDDPAVRLVRRSL